MSTHTPVLANAQQTHVYTTRKNTHKQLFIVPEESARKDTFPTAQKESLEGEPSGKHVVGSGLGAVRLPGEER